jgi:lactoylglutathione lyase
VSLVRGLIEPSGRAGSEPGTKGEAVRVSHAIVFVSDMKRSVSFYRDVLGLPLKFESPGWTEFASEGATLALHASPGATAARDDPRRVPAGRCRPGLSVPNLDEFHARMVEQRVPCVEEPKEVFGARVAQYLDPDGLAISVGEERRAR